SGERPAPRHDTRRATGQTTRTNDDIAFREGKMLQPRRTLLSTALASAILLSAPQTFAQDTAAAPDGEEATELDRIVVTGIRSSIERSIDTKQTSTSMVEAISAEDIGKLPDASIAESI